MAVHNSFESQTSQWDYVYSARTYLDDALAAWVSNATSAQERFGPISAWDVGAVTDMSWLVNGKSSFDEDIDAWDVSKVTSMSQMFLLASTFNQLLNSWQVGRSRPSGTCSVVLPLSIRTSARGGARPPPWPMFQSSSNLSQCNKLQPHKLRGLGVIGLAL